MFAADRDLLTLEPGLFRDLAWTGQRLLDASGSITGTTLTIPGVDLAALGIGPGHVARVGGVALEITARLSATAASISLLRPGDADPLLPPVSVGAAPVQVFTFAPQIAAAHRQVLSMLGIEPDAPPDSLAPGELPESAILNGRSLARLEALLALSSIWNAAAALSPGPSPALDRAENYRLRAAAERTTVAARIDTDGDGRADAIRRPGIVTLTRR